MNRLETPGLRRSHVWGIPRSRMAGYLHGVATALCWAASPILLVKGLVGLQSPLWGVTIGLSVAAAIFAAWAWVKRPEPRMEGLRWSSLSPVIKVALGFQVLAGLASGLGSVARTIAIDVAPVVVVAPLVQTASLWTIVFAALMLGRHVEQVTPKLLLGAVMVVAGAALVIVGLEA
jgi:drug/metabolite transporter (DMT)-like permease